MILTSIDFSWIMLHLNLTSSGKLYKRLIGISKREDIIVFNYPLCFLFSVCFSSLSLFSVLFSKVRWNCMRFQQNKCLCFKFINLLFFLLLLFLFLLLFPFFFFFFFFFFAIRMLFKATNIVNEYKWNQKEKLSVYFIFNFLIWYAFRKIEVGYLKECDWNGGAVMNIAKVQNIYRHICGLFLKIGLTINLMSQYSASFCNILKQMPHWML